MSLVWLQVFGRFNESLNCPSALNSHPTAAAWFLSLASDHILNHWSRKQIHLILGVELVYFFRKMNTNFPVSHTQRMNICAIDTTLLTDGEDGIAEELETTNASIKQRVAFRGLHFTSFIFLVLNPLRR